METFITDTGMTVTVEYEKVDETIILLMPLGWLDRAAQRSYAKQEGAINAMDGSTTGASGRVSPHANDERLAKAQ